MNAPAMPADEVIDTTASPDPRAAALMLALGLLTLGLIFQTEIVTAVLTWEASTAYNHCFLIIPITLYLIWDRQDTLEGLQVRPMPMAALACLPVAAGWLVAERLGIMEGRQLMVVSFAEVLFLAVLGWRLWAAISGPLLYLYFLVPFGEFLVPHLQDITAVFIRHGIALTGIPAYIDGYTIEIPEGTFFVAEACAGLRFLIASIAFGVLYALLMYRGTLRRTAFILVSIGVPIIANGFRALGIVVAGHLLGSAEAAAADHVLYGWIFFSIVILILIALGLPFRQDMDRRPPRVPQPTDGPTSTIAAAFAVAIAVVIGAIGPGAALALDRAGAARIAEPRTLDPGPDCEAVPSAVVDTSAGPGRMAGGRYRCGTFVVDIVIEVFSARSTSGPIMAERRRMTRPPRSENVSDEPLATDDGGRTPWRIVRSPDPVSLAAVGLWIQGEPAAPGFRTRLRLAADSLLGTAAFSPTVVVVAPVLDWDTADRRQQADAERDLTTFLRARPALAEQVRAMARVGQH